MMRATPHAIRCAILFLLAVASAPVAARADDPCSVRGVSRVIAVGDVHGAYDGFVAVLRMAGLVDDEAHWSGGKSHLVQVGDFMDRGAETRKVMDLLIRLQKEAQKAGGRAHVLLGNHEVMNMMGDLRYVNPEEYTHWKSPRSTDLRERFYASAERRAYESARSEGKEFDKKAFRSRFLEQVPLGFVERTQALSSEGDYGRWLRKLPVVAEIDDVGFVHGGISLEVAALGCEGINERVHREITTDLAKTREAPLTTLAAGENGPLWYRGLAQGDEETLAPAVEKILEEMKVRALVVGHTPTKTGRIQTRFQGRVVMIDAGMNEVYGGHRAALEIDGDGTMAALYPEGREVLERRAARLDYRRLVPPLSAAAPSP
jgi:hypothetical protein